jgi:hypothetical protein
MLLRAQVQQLEADPHLSRLNHFTIATDPIHKATATHQHQQWARSQRQLTTTQATLMAMEGELYSHPVFCGTTDKDLLVQLIHETIQRTRVLLITMRRKATHPQHLAMHHNTANIAIHTTPQLIQT